ncbi:EF-hand domain-containing protein [Cinnamomum micranthum f. kanehirae]|uniref:EF-hand domain-containing protein n=1 Tax=Cinnamomum micranthum f. kanehirae TaxID=337451 RepID=A0A3S3NV95_9MAGN|nr:EF-hand domain-containing protein [Cinnamomum micranthum f. kanehirae]
MGQALATIQRKFQGSEWRHKQLRKITDRVFDHFKDDYGKDHLAFEDLYIAVLFVYNDINKHLPGPHIDPPSKASVKTLMETYDTNQDKQLNREEFAEFIQQLTAETLTVVSRNMIVAVVVAPMVALMTKRATEGMPGVGKVVQRIPNSIYATIITLGVVLLQNSGEEVE